MQREILYHDRVAESACYLNASVIGCNGRVGRQFGLDVAEFEIAVEQSAGVRLVTYDHTYGVGFRTPPCDMSMPLLYQTVEQLKHPVLGFREFSRLGVKTDDDEMCKHKQHYEFFHAAVSG